MLTYEDRMNHAEQTLKEIDWYWLKYEHAYAEWRQYLNEEDAHNVAIQQVDVFDARGKDIRDYDLIEQVNMARPEQWEQQIVWIKVRNK